MNRRDSSVGTSRCVSLPKRWPAGHRSRSSPRTPIELSTGKVLGSSTRSRDRAASRPFRASSASSVTPCRRSRSSTDRSSSSSVTSCMASTSRATPLRLERETRVHQRFGPPRSGDDRRRAARSRASKSVSRRVTSRSTKRILWVSLGSKAERVAVVDVSKPGRRDWVGKIARLPRARRRRSPQWAERLVSSGNCAVRLPSTTGAREEWCAGYRPMRRPASHFLGTPRVARVGGGRNLSVCFR